MKKKITITIVISIIVAASVISILTTLLLIGNSPSPRSAYGMVYDEALNKIILFGGGNQEGSVYTSYGDTWIFDPNTNIWAEISTVGAPTPRSSHSMVYDPINQKTILFGGIDQTEVWQNDTWVFDSTTNSWSQMFPTNAPPSRGSASIYYDSIAQKVILFGGYSEIGPHYGDTWSYDYQTNNWTQIFPVTSPIGRYGAPIVYDPINECGFMFGGRTTTITNDNWRFHYSNNSWIKLNTTLTPSSRYWEGLCYDNNAEKMIMFGGRSTSGVGDGLDDTWTFNPTTNEWTQMSPSSHPSHRFHFTLVYIPQSQKTILFGGFRFTDINFGDTWSYQYASNAWNSLK